MFRFIFLLFLCVAVAEKASAGVADFASFFEMDLENDKLPTMEEFEVVMKRSEVYDRKYNSFFDLMGDFDIEFKNTIASYGMQEKRLKGESEDLYIEFLSHVPKKYYQYIGPQLFEIPNMSEKVLNLPGIKETKNKFPTRIAKAVKDIEGIEHLSTHLYYLLMPEMWGEYDDDVEYPQTTPYFPKLIYNKNLGPILQKFVKIGEFNPEYKKEVKKSKSDLRTLHPTKDSLLTSADVKAFLETLDEVDKWADIPENVDMFSRTTILWNMYDREKGIGKFVPAGYLDMVHPCARFVQKSKILGKDNELGAIVAKKGFTVNEWAYTCDKTIKAHRVANIKSHMVGMVKAFRKGHYDYDIKSLSNFTQNYRFALMQGIVQAHKAPMNDILEYRKNRKEFEEKLKKHDSKFFNHRVNGF